MDIIATLPLFLGMRGWQLIVVVLLILLLFGGKKIPELMRGLGKGVHSFKQGLEEAKTEINKPVGTNADTHAAAPVKPTAKAKDTTPADDSTER